MWVCSGFFLILLFSVRWPEEVMVLSHIPSPSQSAKAHFLKTKWLKNRFCKWVRSTSVLKRSMFCVSGLLVPWFFMVGIGLMSKLNFAPFE